LAGVFGQSPVTRTCAIPDGTLLFFPVINAVNINTPNVCGQDANNIPVATLRAQIAPMIEGATQLSVTVDTKEVTSLLHRLQSSVFAVALPEENVFDAPCSNFGGAPAGIYSPAVADGLYVKLLPLPVGQHTLHFHAENLDADIMQDVTYNLTVVPVSRH
jgi:hypothetical protein